MMATSLADRDLRQREIVPPQQLGRYQALVIGVGAVGRQVAWQLAAVGIPALTLVDHDVVDVVNLAPQGYRPQDLGQAKVVATAELCRSLNPEMVIHTGFERFRRSSTRSLPCFDQANHRLAIFCCVDSIETRQLIWETVREHAGFFADARMAAEVLRVLASSDPTLDTHYATTLFSSAEAFAGSCTARSTIYTASIAAGLMLSQFTKLLRQMPIEQDLVLNLLSSELAVS